MQALLALLQDEHFRVRSNAAWALGQLGNSSEQVMQALLARLQDEDSWVRFRAALALVKLGKPSDEIAAAVVQSIEQHQNSEYVGNDIDALWELVAEEKSV